MREIDEEIWLDSDACINSVFVISQKSVKATINSRTDNRDIQFANYALRHYQEQLIRECKIEGCKLHMAFVYHQNVTKALDFPDVEQYLTDEENPDYLSIERNKLFCIDHSVENSDAQVTVSTLWFLAMNLLSQQAKRCREKNEQMDNRIYLISNRDASPKDQRAIISNADRWDALDARVTLICGYKDANHQERNDFEDVLKRFSDSWEVHVCYKTAASYNHVRSWIIE